tara:strand:- start:209 stop:1267 length:1059 start_codon:yes stop_codon:yes gene_type:complete
MVDYTSSNLQGASTEFNNIVSKLNDTKNSALSNLQVDASAASSTLSTQLSGVNTELRSLVPEPVSIPNINLQSQLSSLSGITDPVQSANLLASITTNFGTELSASGFDLDTLVSSAKTAVDGGKSLSFDIPNFEKSADGVSAAVQKAVAVKLPSIDPISETAATFTENTNLTSLKTLATESVKSVSTILPTEDGSQYTITKKTTKITQKSITAEVTTAADAIEGVGEELKRKNISKVGFVSRPINITESVLLDDVSSGVDGPVIDLKQIPTKVRSVTGFDEDGRRRFIIEEPLNKAQVGKFDTFTVSGKEILISETLRSYIEAPASKSKGIEGLSFIVRYVTNSTYDPTYNV